MLVVATVFSKAVTHKSYHLIYTSVFSRQWLYSKVAPNHKVVSGVVNFACFAHLYLASRQPLFTFYMVFPKRPFLSHFVLHCGFCIYRLCQQRHRNKHDVSIGQAQGKSFVRHAASKALAILLRQNPKARNLKQKYTCAFFSMRSGFERKRQDFLKLFHV